jgi:hypothetical protein
MNYAIGCSNELDDKGHCLRGSGSFENDAPCNSEYIIETLSPSAAATADKTRSTDNSLVCNGLKNVCDVPVHKVMFASMHNAQSTAEDGFTIVPDHQKRLELALVFGYRSINIDFGICNGYRCLFEHESRRSYIDHCAD